MKLKTCSQFLISFLKSTLNLEYFERKNQSHSLSTTEIINCETGSYLNSQIPSFMQSFVRQHVNGSQTLVRSAGNQFHTSLPIISVRRSRKRLVLIKSELLGQFVNTLTADYKYSLQNWKNLCQKVPMQTPLKLKTCSQFLIGFVKSTLNLEYLERKNQSHSLSIPEFINCETGSYLNLKKAIFHATLPQTTC